jgi:hypothetical protein
MQTLRRERIQKFTALLMEHNAHPNFITVAQLAGLLADAAESRAERKTDETPGSYGIDWAMAGNRKVTEADLTDKAERLALTAFETALGLPGNWQWYPSKSSIEAEWRALRKFLTAEYAKDAGAFGRYAEWAAGDGRFKGAMSNPKIRSNPELFEASWSEFKKVDVTAKPDRTTMLRTL